MPASSPGADAQLPRSHYFITVARGRAMRTYAVRTGLVRLLLCLLVPLACWTVGSSLYLGLHDDFMASMMAREARMQYAYEDRIAALRNQVEHETTLQIGTKQTLETKLQELAVRAAALESRAGLVSQLSKQAGMTGAADRAPTRVAPQHAAANGAAVGQEASASQQKGFNITVRESKPEPEPENGAPSTDRRAEADGQQLDLRMADLTASLEQTDGAQYHQVAMIHEAARKTTEALTAIIEKVGLSPGRFERDKGQDGVGGPFVPLTGTEPTSPFGHALASVQADISGAERLSRALPRVPLASPLEGELDVTSPFGARTDPFLGTLALHTGADFRGESGGEVRATAPGRIVNAGAVGGYGNMIEVDHGYGLSTRYGHLSAILVRDGQTVDKGEIIGLVGATGRATGPHLHYETRIDGEPVDPMRFLNAGQRLAFLDSATTKP